MLSAANVVVTEDIRALAQIKVRGLSEISKHFNRGWQHNFFIFEQ